MPANKHNDKNLLYCIQMHERAWGQETYPNRPDLADMLAAHVVVFWQHTQDKSRWTVSLHDSLHDVERLLARSVLRLDANSANKRAARIFQHKQLMVITGVRIQFEPAPD